MWNVTQVKYKYKTTIRNRQQDITNKFKTKHNNTSCKIVNKMVIVDVVAHTAYELENLVTVI
jgi:hypothetical protein